MAKTAAQLAAAGKELLISTANDLIYIWDSVAKSQKVIKRSNLIGNLWWEELGRTTLAVAGDTMTVNFTPKKYLQIQVFNFPTGGAIDTQLRFNNDTGNNYAWRYSQNIGASSLGNTQNQIPADSNSGLYTNIITVDIVNNLATEKMGVLQNTSSLSGVATPPESLEVFFKWANTAAQINRVDVFNIAAGDFAIGSEVIVRGHD